MSNKERILQLVNDIPDYKLVFVIDMLENLKAYAGETIEPDEWDIEMMNKAKQENDGNGIELGELAESLGITL